MNTNDFYKQLMSEYSFDREEIRNAAMGKITTKKAAKKTPFPVKKVISIAAMAAAMVLAVGIGSVMLSAPPVSIEQPASSISPTERFRLAIEAYEKADENTEETNLYVTFDKSVSAVDMQNILAKTDSEGNIRVIEVYLSNSYVISGSDNIKALFDTDKENILAVKIRCPGNFIRSLTDTNGVYLVEPEEIFADEGFSVLDPTEEYPQYTVAPETKPPETKPPVTTTVTETTPAETTPAETTGETTPASESEVTQSTPASETTADTPASETTAPAQTPASESEAPATEGTPASESEVTTPEATQIEPVETEAAPDETEATETV